jgi:hypothetical protein
MGNCPPVPGRRIEFRMTAVNNKVYIMGGAGAQPFEYAVYGDNEQYNALPRANTHTTHFFNSLSNVRVDTSRYTLTNSTSYSIPE